jgi:hypothetical protein
MNLLEFGDLSMLLVAVPPTTPNPRLTLRYGIYRFYAAPLKKVILELPPPALPSTLLNYHHPTFHHLNYTINKSSAENICFSHTTRLL